MLRYFLIVFSIILWAHSASAQIDRKLLRQGNQLYQEQKFDEAEIMYRRALEGYSQDQRALFNLGNSLYRQGRFQEAAEIFQALAQISGGDQEKASAWHNLGNSYLENQQIAEGIEAYKNALRLDPASDDTRHNLAYALQLQQDPPPQEQPQQGENEQQKNENEQEQEQEQQPQPRPDQLSPQDAERILNALNQQEQKIQENINKDNQRVPARVEKEW